MTSTPSISMNLTRHLRVLILEPLRDYYSAKELLHSDSSAPSHLLKLKEQPIVKCLHELPRPQQVWITLQHRRPYLS